MSSPLPPPRSPPPHDHISCLPPEILSSIFVFVPTPDLIFNVSNVCRHWRTVATPLIPAKPFAPHYKVPGGDESPPDDDDDEEEARRVTDRKIAGFCGVVLTLIIIVLAVSGAITYHDCKAKSGGGGGGGDEASAVTVNTSAPPAAHHDHCWRPLLAFEVSAAFLAMLLCGGAFCVWLATTSMPKPSKQISSETATQSESANMIPRREDV